MVFLGSLPAGVNSPSLVTYSRASIVSFLYTVRASIGVVRLWKDWT